MSFEVEFPLKKPPKPYETIFNLINNQNSRRFLDIWGLVQAFILKQLSIGVMQTITFFTWANQNSQYVTTTSN